MTDATLSRCKWCGTDPLYVAYHDTEWGVPEHDSRALWEKLVLDGMQAGLAWITILRKREGIRDAFANFDPDKVAAFDDADIERLLNDARIIRSRAKIIATIESARLFVQMHDNGEDFAEYLWAFVGGKPIQNALVEGEPYPTQSAESVAMSKALKKRGFKFVGPVIVYAFMQAVGMVNDHMVTCFRHAEVGAGKV
jgi:DNA-3-methyladenine glycosylase I